MPRVNRDSLHDEEQPVTLSFKAQKSQERSREAMFEAFESSIMRLKGLLEGNESDHVHKCSECKRELVSRADAKTATTLLRALLPYVQKMMPQTIDVQHSGKVTVENTGEVQAGFFRIVDQLPREVQQDLLLRLEDNLKPVVDAVLIEEKVNERA